MTQGKDNNENIARGMAKENTENDTEERRNTKKLNISS